MSSNEWREIFCPEEVQLERTKTEINLKLRDEYSGSYMFWKLYESQT